MKPDTGDFVKFWSAAISRRNVVDAMLASAMALQVYDWLLILPQEAKYIWRASWDWSKALYLVVRYIPFFAIALTLYQLVSNPSPESCKSVAQVTVWVSFAGLALVEAVLIIRTYVVWRGDKRVGFGLAFLFVVCQATKGIILKKWIDVANPIHNPYLEFYQGCTMNEGTRLVFATWVITTVEEGVNLLLMVINAVNTYLEHPSDLMGIVHRDGVRFYFYIFCATLTNVLVTMVLPIDFDGIGSIVEIVLHSTLACRLIIAMREASEPSFECESETLELSEVPSLEFLPA